MVPVNTVRSRPCFYCILKLIVSLAIPILPVLVSRQCNLLSISLHYKPYWHCCTITDRFGIIHLALNWVHVTCSVGIIRELPFDFVFRCERLTITYGHGSQNITLKPEYTLYTLYQEEEEGPTCLSLSLSLSLLYPTNYPFRN